MEMVEIPSGSFCMGSPYWEANRWENEGPQHLVTVRSFYMDKYEVTQSQWKAVMGSLPPGMMSNLDNKFVGNSLPVVNVSWNEAVEFCQKLSLKNGVEYRLPTEAEWEYACRAGTTTPFAFGSSLSSTQANIDGRYPYGGAAKGVYRERPTPVGSFPSNKYGLHDMHGNVWEWCQSKHKPYPYKASDGRESISGSEGRVLRGGSLSIDGDLCRSAFRGLNGGVAPDVRSEYNGFRVVATAQTRQRIR